MYVTLDDDDDCTRMCYDELMMVLFCILSMCTCYLNDSDDGDDNEPQSDDESLCFLIALRLYAS